MTCIPPLPQQNHAPIKVLLVDDMPQVRHDLRLLLELTGLFEIIAEAGDGREAVRRAAEFRPDAIVIDLELPGLDGYEATRRIKAQTPGPRVIILTAYAGPGEMARARQAGADGFVVKGQPYEVLVAAILGRDCSPISFEA